MSDTYDIAASGMAAQRTQMDLIAENLANAGMPRADGTVFRGKTAVLEQSSPFELAFADALGAPSMDFAGFDADNPELGDASGVSVVAVADRNETPQYRFDPGSPFAMHAGLHKGYVALPGVDPIQQMVSLISAGRAYDANVSMLTAAKQMDLEAADIDRA